MKALVRATHALISLSILGGCAAASRWTSDTPVRAPAESITISVGPCFGFCPVYDAAIASDGTVIFTGRRHTAVLGERRRRAAPANYRALRERLHRFRPADGTAVQVRCDAAMSDTSSYSVTWIGTDGGRRVATHAGGCPQGEGQMLDEVLREVPQMLGIADWMQQTTRSGASRG